MEVQIIKKEENIRNRLCKNRFISKLGVVAYCKVSSDTENQLNSYQSQLKYYNSKISMWNYETQQTLTEIYEQVISEARTEANTSWFLRSVTYLIFAELGVFLVNKNLYKFMKRDVVELYEEDERENETIIMNNDGNDNLTTNSESDGSVNNVKWDL